MGTPLPAQFTDYMADGKLVTRGELKKGQLVKNATTTTQTGSISTASGKVSLTTSNPPAPAQKSTH